MIGIDHLTVFVLLAYAVTLFILLGINLGVILGLKSARRRLDQIMATSGKPEENR